MFIKITESCNFMYHSNYNMIYIFIMFKGVLKTFSMPEVTFSSLFLFSPTILAVFILFFIQKSQ